MTALMPIDALMLATAASYASTIGCLGLGRGRCTLVSLGTLVCAGGACSLLALQETGLALWVLSGLSGTAWWPLAL